MNAQAELFAVPVGEGALSPVAGVDVGELIAQAQNAVVNGLSEGASMMCLDPDDWAEIRKDRANINEYFRLLRGVGRGDIVQELQAQMKGAKWKP